jgi:hypothetical protein
VVAAVAFAPSSSRRTVSVPGRVIAHTVPAAAGSIRWRLAGRSCDGAPVLELSFDEHRETVRRRWPELFEPAVVDPAVTFLAELAG